MKNKKKITLEAIIRDIIICAMMVIFVLIIYLSASNSNYIKANTTVLVGNVETCSFYEDGTTNKYLISVALPDGARHNFMTSCTYEEGSDITIYCYTDKDGNVSYALNESSLYNEVQTNIVKLLLCIWVLLFLNIINTLYFRYYSKDAKRTKRFRTSVKFLIIKGDFMLEKLKNNKNFWIDATMFVITIFVVSFCVVTCFWEFKDGANKVCYDNDEIFFRLIGKQWASGIPLYSGYFDHKGPVVFLFFYIGYLIDFASSRGIMFLYIIWVSFSIHLIYIIFKKNKLFDNKKMDCFVAELLSLSIILAPYLLFSAYGIIVGMITMPFTLVCVNIAIRWYSSETFLSDYLSHIIYGFCCMMVILARASDAVFIFVLYISIWVLHLKNVKLALQKAVITIISGFTTFLVFFLYFKYYGVEKQFMYCTFWANFKYLSSSSEYSAYECFIFGINVVMAFIFLLFYLFKKKSVENRIIISIVPALILHFTIYFLSTMFVQYLFVFISDFILLLFFALRDVKIQVFNKKLMFNVVVFMFSIFLISIIIISNILENMQYEYESYVIDYADKIVDELKESGDSFLIYDDAILSERLLENGLMSDAHYIMCQKWHADLGLISVEDLKNDLERISPDIVIVSNYQYGHSSFYQDNLLSDYELVRADEVWKETDGVYGDELTYYIYRRAD